MLFNFPKIVFERLIKSSADKVESPDNLHTEILSIDAEDAVTLIDALARGLLTQDKDDLRGSKPLTDSQELFELWEVISSRKAFLVTATLTSKLVYKVYEDDEDNIDSSLFDSDDFITGDEEIELDIEPFTSDHGIYDYSLEKNN